MGTPAPTPTPYRIHLEMYEGPLDLLLDLIRKQEIDIHNIPISKITGQYLEYLHKLEELNVDVSAEFIYMAATLIYIKSKMLLPPDPLAAEEGQAEDPREPVLDGQGRLGRRPHAKHRGPRVVLGHHPAPLDPNFDGIGRAITDAGGRYRFVTIAPGAYPWGNHYNAWRPAHIHFSLFGRAFTQRLVTQMYFPGDPLLPLAPIFNSVPDEKARQRLVADFDIELTQPEWALGYHWDIVLRGRDATVFE